MILTLAQPPAIASKAAGFFLSQYHTRNTRMLTDREVTITASQHDLEMIIQGARFSAKRVETADPSLGEHVLTIANRIQRMVRESPDFEGWHVLSDRYTDF